MKTIASACALAGTMALAPVAHAQPTPPRQVVFSPSEPEAELQVEHEDAEGSKEWKPICTGPCTTTLFPGAQYRVSGEGITTSKTFTVDAAPNPLQLRADAGSSGARTTGVVLAYAGGAGMVAGLFYVALGGMCILCDEGEKSSKRAEAWQIGGPIMLGGVAVLAGGLVLMVSNKTKLDFGPNHASAAPRLELGKGFELAADGLRF